MGATLAAVTFIVFITLDYVFNYRKDRATRLSHEQNPVPIMPLTAAPKLEPVWVGGYEFAEDPSYHPGHAWAKVVAPDTVLVGMDDFAGRLVGKINKISLPKPGSWFLQGQKSVEFETDRGKTALLTPIEGEVLRVNDQVAHDPGLASSDPYRRGWLYEVRSSNLANNFRNLLQGSLAKCWLEDAKTNLEHNLMGLSRTVFADGGQPAEDYADHLEPADWAELARTLLRN